MSGMTISLLKPVSTRPVSMAATAKFKAEIRRLDQLLLLGVLGLVLVMGGTKALQLRVGLRPPRGLLADLVPCDRGRWRRVEETLPRELVPLAAAVNQLLSHDDRALVRTRDQAADLAHAIKTPLAVLRTDLKHLDPVLAAGGTLVLKPSAHGGPAVQTRLPLALPAWGEATGVRADVRSARYGCEVARRLPLTRI